MILKELEGYLEVNKEVEYKLFEEVQGEHCLWLEEHGIYIEMLQVKIYSGYCENYNECSEEYTIDFDFYMFFDAITGEHLYEEAGSSLEVCIYNFTRSVAGKSLTYEEVENLRCEVVE